MASMTKQLERTLWWHWKADAEVGCHKPVSSVAEIKRQQCRCSLSAHKGAIFPNVFFFFNSYLKHNVPWFSIIHQSITHTCTALWPPLKTHRQCPVNLCTNSKWIKVHVDGLRRQRSEEVSSRSGQQGRNSLKTEGTKLNLFFFLFFLFFFLNIDI